MATRVGWLPQAAIGGLNSFVLFFALPCMLFRFGSATPIGQLLDVPLALTYLALQLVLLAFIVAVTRSERIDWNNAAFGALVTIFPNTGFMGVPLLVALLGAQAAGPVIVTITVDLVVISSLGIAVSRLGESGGARSALVQALKGVLKNPMPWAILSGAVFSAYGLALPSVAQRTVGLLADAASPVALFTIGAVLARSQIMARTDATEAVLWRDVLPLAAIKLVLHPLAVLLAGVAAIQAGLPISKFALTVATLAAALPSASNVSLLAERFGANNGRIARIILVSTAAAFFTFPLAVSLLV